MVQKKRKTRPPKDLPCSERDNPQAEPLCEKLQCFLLFLILTPLFLLFVFPEILKYWFKAFLTRHEKWILCQQKRMLGYICLLVLSALTAAATFKPDQDQQSDLHLIAHRLLSILCFPLYWCFILLPQIIWSYAVQFMGHVYACLALWNDYLHMGLSFIYSFAETFKIWLDPWLLVVRNEFVRLGKLGMNALYQACVCLGTYFHVFGREFSQTTQMYASYWNLTAHKS